jgi:hypothetical protein
VWTVAVPESVEVPVLVGSPFRPGKPDVVGTRVTAGTQVIAVGAPRSAEDGDGVWLPIAPPPGEYRYVRETDVAATPPAAAPAATTTTAHAGSAAALAGVGAGSPSTITPPPAAGPSALEVRVGPPAPPADVDSLLQQAEQMERANNRLEAARLYDQLANSYATSRPDVATQYHSRAAWLRGSAYRVPAPPVNEADALYVQARQYEQAGNRAEASRLYARLGDLYRDNDYKLAMQYYNRAAWLRQGQPAPRTSPAPAVAASPAPPSGVVQVGAVNAQLIGPGRLVSAGKWIDARPTYLLESPQAEVMAYLTPQPGVDLDRYVGQNVEVLGQIVPRADVRGQYMTVARVLPLSAP